MKKSLLILAAFCFFALANAQEAAQEVKQKQQVEKQQVKSAQADKAKLPNRAAQLKAIPIQKANIYTTPKIVTKPNTQKVEAVSDEKVPVKMKQEEPTTK